MSRYVHRLPGWIGVVLICGTIAGASPAAAASAELPYTTSTGRMQSTLDRYRSIEARGGWPVIPAGPALQSGSSGPAIARLRERLSATGDLVAADGNGTDFDSELAAAVMRFQSRHGLAADGVVGQRTRAVLNVPVSARIRQIDANLQRLRSLPVDADKRTIIVNVAAFDLNVIEHGKVTFASPVIVGRRSRQTPVLSSTVTRIIVNPPWQIPRRIAWRDILPKVKKDPAYLSAQAIRIYRISGESRVEIAPETVPWQSLTPRTFNYTLIQDPGPLNALGRVKFFLPNDQDIYLHDTPARELFKQDLRAFSSGCVRVDKALALAEFLLRRDDARSLSALSDALETGKTTPIALKTPVPVHIVYLTAWADADGRAHFRDDIYTLDGIAEALPAQKREKLQEIAQNFDKAYTSVCVAVPNQKADLR